MKKIQAQNELKWVFFYIVKLRPREKNFAYAEKTPDYFLEAQWKIVSKSTMRKNVCKWYSTTIIFGVNNQLGKIGFIKVLNT